MALTPSMLVSAGHGGKAIAACQHRLAEGAPKQMAVLEWQGVPSTLQMRQSVNSSMAMQVAPGSLQVGPVAAFHVGAQPQRMLAAGANVSVKAARSSEVTMSLAAPLAALRQMPPVPPVDASSSRHAREARTLVQTPIRQLPLALPIDSSSYQQSTDHVNRMRAVNIGQGNSASCIRQHDPVRAHGSLSQLRVVTTPASMSTPSPLPVHPSLGRVRIESSVAFQATSVPSHRPTMDSERNTRDACLAELLSLRDDLDADVAISLLESTNWCVPAVTSHLRYSRGPCREAAPRAHEGGRRGRYEDDLQEAIRRSADEEYSGGFAVPPMDMAIVKCATRDIIFRCERPVAAADNDCCAVCLMNFEDGERLRKLPCGHCFHTLCVDQWLVRSAQCPTCKTPVVNIR